MKKVFFSVISLLLVFSLTACNGTFTQGTLATRPTRIEATVPPDVPEEELFKVTLLLNGAPIQENEAFYMSYLKMEIYAEWYDGQSYYIAKFDENGVAKAAGLDGTFRVTLSDVPFDYTYDVNVYQASNDKRQIDIQLYRLYDAEPIAGDGSHWAFPYVKEFSNLGVYEFEIDGPDDAVFFRYEPGTNGIYVVESWASVAEDNINPKVEVWSGTTAFAYLSYTEEEGGTKGTYTSNFKVERDVDDAEVGNVFIFRLSATAKDGIYPIKVKVAIHRTGDMPDRYDRIRMLPTEIIRQATKGKGQLTQVGYTLGDRFVLDNTMCKLWPKSEGGDDYYHLYDEEKYASTNGYGPTLYANVNRFSTSTSLSVQYKDTFLDYRMFFRGFESLAEYRIVMKENGVDIWGSELCSGMCTCKHQTLASPSEPTGSVTLYACIVGCEQCHEQCIQVTKEEWGTIGYCEGANTDGYYPVTEEIKFFLQVYAENRNLFNDGNGDYENQGIDADQDSMWLWGVRYYSEDEGGACKMEAAIKTCFERDPNNFPSVS